MAAISMNDAPTAIVEQWYKNIYSEFGRYIAHYTDIIFDWGCCGRCKTADEIEAEIEDGKEYYCGKLPRFALDVNDTIYTDQFIPSILPDIFINRGHIGKYMSCGEYCLKCRDFQRDANHFDDVCTGFSSWDKIKFKTNIDLELYINNRIHILSQSNLHHYSLNIAELMCKTLKKFYQLLFVSSGKHTKAARREAFF
jgi:hypothetical protein